MTAVPPQQVQIKCPNCGTPYRAQLFSLIDVGQQPEIKTPFLLGQLNIAVCPNCNTALPLATDTVYHDGEKKLLLVYSPQGQGSRPEDQERFVGELTNFLMRSLPPEQPKGYLLAPRRFMSMQSLVDAILDADGISREQFESQIAKVNLVYMLASSLESDEQFAALVSQYRDEIDEDLFALLAAYIDTSSRAGQPESSSVLVALRERLLEALDSLPEPTLDDDAMAGLLDLLHAASDAELPQLLAEQRGEIDYAFFERWTERIDAALAAGDAAEAAALTVRRQQILEAVEQMDREAQQLFEQASALLRQAYEAPDARPVLEANHEGINEAFFLVVEAGIGSAERAGDSALVARLELLGRTASEVLQAAMTPEERLIGQLLAVETPQERTKLLRQNATQVTPAFVKQLNELADRLGTQGQQEPGDAVRRLAREAGAMLF